MSCPEHGCGARVPITTRSKSLGLRGGEGESGRARAGARTITEDRGDSIQI